MSILILSGCAPSGLQIDAAGGASLARVSEHVQDQDTLLIQDVSPRVGLDASYRDGDDQSGWIVVASCSNNALVDEATTTEVAVIPKYAYSAAVKSAITDGDYVDAVTCDGLSYR